MTIEKLDPATPDLTRQNIARLAELFPECVTEGPEGSASDRSEPVIDFDLLRQALADHLVEGPQERYRLDWPGKRQALLMATGSEVSVAMAARDILEAEGIGTRVVSMPCWELFEEQDEAYRKRVLPGGPVRVAVEAGVRLGWDRWLFGERGKREKSGFVGMHGFGSSAPAETLYEKFGITAEATAQKVRDLLMGNWQETRR